MSFWVWYDYMGTYFIFNLCLMGPMIFLTLFLFSNWGKLSPLFYIFICYMMGLYFFVTNVFVSAFTSAILERREGLKERLFYALKIVVCKSIPVGVLFLLLSFILILNIWFYVSKKFFNSLYANYILTGFFVWLGIFTVIALLWIIPSLSFKKMSFWKYVYWGYILLFANPYFSFQVFFCYTILYLLNIFPLFFFFIGMVIPSIFLTCAYEILSRKYEALRTSGDKLEDYQIFRDYEDEFLNRNWEHLIKPWKL